MMVTALYPKSPANLPHSESEQHTIILGAGIIGCATAFYLSTSTNARPEKIHLVEASPELFASASGKAGGFLASDWFGPSTASLGQLSFDLHKDLADKYDGLERWGYSSTTSTSLVEGDGFKGATGAARLGTGGTRAQSDGVDEFYDDKEGPPWLRRRKGDKVEMIGQDGGVAQVDPLRLSRFLLEESRSRGVNLHYPAEARKINIDEDGKMYGITLSHREKGSVHLPCTRLLITAGAWTPKVFNSLFPSSTLRIPILQLAGHSLVVKSPRWTKQHETKGCHAIFTSMQNGFSPEVFSRIGGDIYIAGLNDPALPLPDVAADAMIDSASIEEMKGTAERLLMGTNAASSDLEVIRGGICFRPITNRGVPILSRIPDRELVGIAPRKGVANGVFIAAGHGPWGISLSLGTGLVMAEMLEGRETSADIEMLGLN